MDSDRSKEAALDEVHIGATWRIPLNRPCAAAMRPFLSNYFDQLFVMTAVVVAVKRVTGR